MAANPMGEVIHSLRMVLREEAGLTDAQLLADYFQRQDAAALAFLVKRHAPMVWSVCRRVLGNHHDADDAFQATFLVFVRKAASIRNKELLANWLYGVARQTALKARTTAAKRNEREKQVMDMPDAAETQEKLVNDLQPLLDQELGRLPEKYRAVIVLCELEGRTRHEAARSLGCAEGTVASRLARARTMLAKRLARHGLPVSVGVLTALLAPQAALANIPSAVVNATISAARRFAAGQTAVAISPKVVALANGVLKMMLLKKLTSVTLVTVLASLLGLMASAWVMGQTKTETRLENFTAQEAISTYEHVVPVVERALPKPFPDEVVQAWKDAGATVGLMWVDRSGGIHFNTAKEEPGGQIPGFQLDGWRNDVLSKLPDPGMPFGLDLVGTKVTDAGLKELAGLKNLQMLNLSVTQVTDAGLKELAGLKNLQSLALYNTEVTDTGLKELAGLKGLQSLKLGVTADRGAQVTDAGLKGLAGLKNLQTLSLFNTKVTDAGLKELAGLKSLQSLDLGSTQVTDAGLKELAGLASLQSLDLRSTRVTDTGLKELAGLKSLETLNLIRTEVTDAGLKKLAGLTSLQALYLDVNQSVTDAGLKELAGLKNLRTLSLFGTKVTGAGLKELAGLKSIQTLNLWNSPVTDAGLKELAALTSLQALKLAGTRVTDAGLKELAGLKSLQSLNLYSTQVTDAGLKELAGLKSLRMLNLQETHVTAAGVAELRQALPECKIDR